MRPKSKIQRERQALRGAPHTRDAHCEVCNARSGEDCRGKHALATGYHDHRAQLATEFAHGWHDLSPEARQHRLEAFYAANRRAGERYHSRGAAKCWISTSRRKRMDSALPGSIRDREAGLRRPSRHIERTMRASGEALPNDRNIFER